MTTIQGGKSKTSAKIKLNDDNFDENLFQSFYTSDDRKISVYNKFLLPSTVYLLRRYLSDHGRWEHTLNNYNNGSDFREESPDHILWKTFLDPQFMETTKVGQKIIRAVKHFQGNQDGSHDYHIYHATAKIVVRSELPKSSIDADDSDGDVSAIIYLTGKWQKNDYGDILFYDNNKEIVSAIHPVMFRMVMFDSTIEHLYKPPSIDHSDPLRTIHFKLTTSKNKLNKAIQDYKARTQHRHHTRHIKLNDIAPLSSPRTIHVQQHITRQFVAPSGKKIYVLDNIFTPEELNKLRQIVEYKEYVHQQYLDKGSDGVSWLANFSLQDFVESNLWKIHQQVVNYFGSRKTYFPYDISCNMIKNTDNTRIHTDCSLAADQWTMVTYLNPNWTAQMGGETAFFEKNTHENNNYIIQVRPRYGRSVIFQSTIYHSARPPANHFDGLRYSFSVKMAEDEPQARLNRLTEDFSIYVSNLEQYDSITKIGRKAGYAKTEKGILAMLTAEDVIIPADDDNQRQSIPDQDDDDEQDTDEQGIDQPSQQDNSNSQEQSAQGSCTNISLLTVGIIILLILQFFSNQAPIIVDHMT